MTHLAQIKALDLTKILNKDVTSEIENSLKIMRRQRIKKIL